MSSIYRLARKTAIVTGAGSGIGAAVARTLSEHGCRVVLADVNMEQMEKVAKTCVGMSPKHQSDSLLIQCDVTDPSQVQALVDQADEFAAHLSSKTSSSSSPSLSSPSDNVPKMASILVNSAGITRDNWMSQMTMQEWHNVVDTNLTSTFLTCRAFCDAKRLSKMSENNSNGDSILTTPCSIINIGSVVSEQGNLGQVNYAASKGGVVGLTRSLAKEMALLLSPQKNNGEYNYNSHHHKKNNSKNGETIRVNAILPGFIDTEMTKKLPEHVRQRIISKIALRRFGRPQDVANLVSFLASDVQSGYITGECLEVSGMISL